MIDAREDVMTAPAPKNRRPTPVSASRSDRRSSGVSGKAKGFQRVFSDAKVSPFDQIEWDKRTAEITDDGGKVIFKQENVEVPKSWSVLATKVVVSKYFYGEQNTRARNLRAPAHPSHHPHHRGLGHQGWLLQQGGRRVFYQELTWLCLNQYGAFNSPVWFNVGLYHQYGVGKIPPRATGITIRKTNASRTRAPTQYEYPQCSACFIQSVDDNMESIMHLAYSEAMLFKFGSGTGTDLTPIRSAREKLSGGGRPSGPMSFLKVYDQVANVVKSGGKTRRAAKMNTLRDWHGDIEEFMTPSSAKKEGVGADRAGLRRFLQRRSLRQRHVPERKPVRPRGDEFMQAGRGRQGMVDQSSTTTGKPLEKKDAAKLLDQDRRRHLDLRRPRPCNTTAPSRSGTPARAPSRFTPPIRAANTCSSTTPRATSPR
jgi:ribonucleoside-diphosphate reductase alpha chain